MCAAKQPDRDMQIEREVRAELGPHELEGLMLDVHDGVVYLQGTVTSPRGRHIAEELARRVPGVRDVVNEVNVQPLGLQELSQAEVLEPLNQADVELQGTERVEDTWRDFSGEIGTTDAQEATEEAMPFFPPTDPVIRIVPREREGIEVRGGFAGSSMDEPSYEGDPTIVEGPGDAEIAEDVRVALDEDAATADLNILVYVRRGVVHLRGKVPSLADAEMAEEVAGRVPGVVEVREELEVPDLDQLGLGEHGADESEPGLGGRG